MIVINKSDPLIDARWHARSRPASVSSPGNQVTFRRQSSKSTYVRNRFSPSRQSSLGWMLPKDVHRVDAIGPRLVLAAQSLVDGRVQDATAEQVGERHAVPGVRAELRWN